MGFFKQSRNQKERKAYRQILAKQKTQAARQAYADEAVKVAIEKAKAKARRPSFGETLKGYAKGNKQTRIKQTRRASVSRKTSRQPQNLSQALYGY